MLFLSNQWCQNLKHTALNSQGSEKELNTDNINTNTMLTVNLNNGSVQDNRLPYSNTGVNYNVLADCDVRTELET